MIHYHAQPGGVTSVVERAVEALGDRVESFFLTGEAPQGESVLRLHIRVVPDAGYAPADSPQPDFVAAAIAAFGVEPDLWHIHNHSLGKNPAFTAAVLRLAETGRRLLLQIHDFAEDGRPQNYRQLGPLVDRLYPVAKHVHYAVLNRRDHAFLRRAGVPNDQLHLLPNAVTPMPETSGAQATESGLYVYPCRAIRRKNIGELLLWSALMPEAQFAVTLAPRNPQARPVYDAWAAFAREERLDVRFAASEQIPYPELVASAEALITTSIAEGFGMAFLEPWLAGKPLVGRNLPAITGDFTEHGLDLSPLYSRLPVPLELPGADFRDRFLSKLEQALRSNLESYNRPYSHACFEQATAALVGADGVDFGILDEELQRAVVRAARRDPRPFPHRLQSTASLVQRNRAVAETHYPLAAYGDRLAALYDTVLASTPGPLAFADGQKLLDEFLAPGRINLLRT